MARHGAASSTAKSNTRDCVSGTRYPAGAADLQSVHALLDALLEPRDRDVRARACIKTHTDTGRNTPSPSSPRPHAALPLAAPSPSACPESLGQLCPAATRHQIFCSRCGSDELDELATARRCEFPLVLAHGSLPASLGAALSLRVPG
eukprot:2502006-Rhodomonas_salina.1